MIIIYILIGLLSGIISGMGIGGGAILIPALITLTKITQHEAQSTNLIYFIPTAIIALFSHAKSGNIEKKIVPKIIVFGIVGAILGSMLAINLNSDVLRRIFGFFFLAIGVYELFFAGKLEDKNEQR